MKLTELKPRLATLQDRLTPRRVERIRGTTLQNIRKAHLDKHPLCKHCEAEGRTTPATELDHIVPLHKGGADAESNRQGLCHAHHAAKTRAERNAA